MIDKALGLGCPEPPETYSSSSHLYTELGIPPEASGTVGAPRTARAKRDRSAQRNTPRSRRRTRAGKPVSGHPSTNAESATELPGGDGTHSGRRRRPRRAASVAVPVN